MTTKTITRASAGAPVDLASYDYILVNSSAGKDSQAMLTTVNALAAEQGVADRIVVVHCDLGRVEWTGTRELAEEQARHYGNRFEVVANPRDFLERVEARGQWPGMATRYCTSEFKTNQVRKLCTQLADEYREAHPAPAGKRERADMKARATGHYKRVRILNCLGIRAAESDERAKKPPFVIDEETTYHKNGKVKERNSRRQVDRWFPIFGWSTEQVWDTIRASGVRYHEAYDKGMPRLSCVFCIYADAPELLIAGHHNRALLSEYAALEGRMNHTFKHGLSLIQIERQLEAGYVPPQHVPDAPRRQCAA